MIFPTSIAGIIALDLATKAWALTLPAGGIPVLPFFDLHLGFNRGISFGMFAAEGVQGYVILIALTLLLSGMFFWLGSRAERGFEKAGFAAITGGALGNLFDRIPDGAVTDFLSLHAGGWHFPTFNVADIAISAGTAALLVATLRQPDESPVQDKH
jgi:signal peptidase II